MANSGKNSNTSQFYFTLAEQLPQLNGKHVLFGHICEGLDLLKRIGEYFQNRLALLIVEPFSVFFLMLNDAVLMETLCFHSTSWIISSESIELVLSYPCSCIFVSCTDFMYNLLEEENPFLHSLFSNQEHYLIYLEAARYPCERAQL